MAVEMCHRINRFKVIRVDTHLVLTEMVYRFSARVFACCEHVAETVCGPTDMPMSETPIPTDIFGAGPFPTTRIGNDVVFALNESRLTATSTNTHWKHNNPH